jgi:glyoxylase-like metal-dependent hydrolase (beta-lactamase superfamily II)
MEPICLTCGTQYSFSESTPAHCLICEDDRQYVGFDGQQWTTLNDLRAAHHNEFLPLEAGLTAILTKPPFAIGQRALLLETPSGNILWDCLTLIDQKTIHQIRERGGLAAIAISHPHYYSTLAEWSRAFGGIPVYLHELDRQWVMRPDTCIRFWHGESLRLHDGITLIRGGGHFPGGAMLHWPAGAGGRGALLSGDIIQVVPDMRWVSFMYSYPNLIPLNAAAVLSVAASVEEYAFDRIYGAFHPRQVMADAKGVLRRSVERYLEAIAE